MRKPHFSFVTLALLCAALGVQACAAQTRSRRTTREPETARTQAASQSSGGRVIAANQMPGATLAAKIKNADAALGAERGEIHVRGGGELSEPVIIGGGHTLRLFAGTYQVAFDTTHSGAFLLKDGASIVGEGWQTVIVEPRNLWNTIPVRIIRVHQDTLATDNPARDIIVRDLQIKGTEGVPQTGVTQTVTLGNCTRCTAENLFLNGTHGIGIQAGGNSNTGNFASDVVIRRNKLTNVPSQNIAVVNGERIRIEENTITDPSAKAVTAITAIDIEVNTAIDKVNDIQILNNTIDLRNSAQAVFGIVFQSAGVPNNGRSVIRGNKILGHPILTTIAIHLPDPSSTEMIVEDNSIDVAAVGGIALNGKRLTVQRNQLTNAGGEGCIILGTVTDSRITNNKCEYNNGNSAVIKENISVRNNYIAFNQANYIVREDDATSISGNTYEGNDLSRQVAGHANGFVNQTGNISNNTYIDNATAFLDDPLYHSGFPALARGERGAVVRSHRTTQGGLKVHQGNRPAGRN